MTDRDDRPPLRLAEPPFDPDYDRPPIADRDAERAILATLLNAPATANHLGERLARELERDDFYWPAHQLIWDTWHDLYQSHGCPPDAVLLNATVVRRDPTRGREAAHTLLDLATDITTNPLLVDQHVRIVRDHARLRVVDETATHLRKLVNHHDAARVDHAMAEALDTLDEAAGRFGPRDTHTTTGLKDLSWVDGGSAPTIPPPTICHRTDGTALFYAGKVNGIFGDPETAKTWLAQVAGVEALNNGGTLAMIDVDHNGPDHTAARLLLLGAQAAHVANPHKFRYYEPEDADQLRAAVTDITRLAPTVVIIDSLGEIFPMLGVNTNDGDEMTSAMRQVCTQPANAGSCVITIDHLPKSTEARSTGYAIGSIAKKRMIRGTYLRAEARTQPAPGTVGRVTLRIEKDTAGELRKSSGGGYAGTFVLDSSQQLSNGYYATKWEITREAAPKNDDGTFRPTVVMEKVSRFIEENDLCSFRTIKDSVTAKDKVLRDAINLLISEGFVSRLDGPRGSKLHHSIAHYREAEDDHLNPTN